MNRRTFIKETSLVAGAMYVPSALMGFKPDEVIFGHNNKRYRINTQWSKAVAAQQPVKDCHEMVQDKLGRILLLTNETKNNILIYNKDGKVVSSWGHDYPGAHGLSLFNENGEDTLFICDNNLHQVIKTTMDGRVLLRLDRSG